MQYGCTPAVLQCISMPTYQYQCHTCGRFDVVRPMAEGTTSANCPGCAAVARRVFGLPGVRLVAPGLRSALDASAASADSPSVVTSVPGRSPRATPVTADPRHAKLPRP
jgi:putative FmdB family regulatory protein